MPLRSGSRSALGCRLGRELPEPDQRLRRQRGARSLGEVAPDPCRLGFVAGPGHLDWITLISVATLAGTFIAAGKRGLLNPR